MTSDQRTIADAQEKVRDILIDTRTGAHEDHARHEYSAEEVRDLANTMDAVIAIAESRRLRGQNTIRELQEVIAAQRDLIGRQSAALLSVSANVATDQCMTVADIGGIIAGRIAPHAKGA